jgi:hypothetical protein
MAPQGYPGPAVAAPPPAAAPGPYPAFAAPPPAAPAPQYAAPPPGYPPQAAPPGYPPQYAQPAPVPYAAPPQYPPGYAPAPQQAPAYGQQPPQSNFIAPMSPSDIGAAIAGATGGDRSPAGEPGVYTLEILETLCTVHPIERKLTFKANFKIIASTNPSFPPDAENCYLEGLKYESSGKRIQDFLIAAQGYPAKIVYEQTMAAAGRDPKAELALLGSAAGNSQTPIAGNHYPPNPLKGRRVKAVVARETKIAGPRSPKAGQQVTYTTWRWEPAA